MPTIVKQKKWGPEYTQPVAPVTVHDGLTWYDTSSNELKVWDENSSSWRWASTGSGARFGYVCGGGFTTYFTGIQRVDFPFSSAVALQVGNLQTSKNNYSSGCNSSNYGYVMGGHELSSIRRFDFPFQSGIAEVAGDMTDKMDAASCNSSQHGYSMGGYDATSVDVISVDRITFPFSSGTASVVGNMLGAKRGLTGCNSSQHGYAIGGNSGPITYSYVERIAFPFNSGSSTHNSTMSHEGTNGGSFNSSQHAFAFGLSVGSVNSFVDRFAFPFNSGNSAVVGNLAVSGSYGTGLNSTQVGYVIGMIDDSAKTVHFQELEFPFDSGIATKRGVLSSEQFKPTSIDGVDFVTQFI